jgi:hypothetical protein
MQEERSCGREVEKMQNLPSCLLLQQRVSARGLAAAQKGMFCQTR